MKLNLFRRTTIAALILSALEPGLSAQEPTFTIKVDVPFVSVDLGVKAGSKSVQGLTKEDFELYEDGQLQNIKHFASAPEPIKLLAVTCCPLSYEEGLRTRAVINTPELYEQFVNKLYAVMVTQKWPPGNPSPGNNFSYGQLRTAVEKMRTVPGRKGIVVLSSVIHRDAEPDNRDFDGLLQLVRESAIPMYFFHYDRPYPNGQDRFDRLKLLAETSGGRMIATPIVAGSITVGMEAATEFIRDLASTLYTVGYSPSNPADGKAHKIEIRLSEQRMNSLKNQKVKIWQSRDQYSREVK
jgi:hypothetical protein